MAQEVDEAQPSDWGSQLAHSFVGLVDTVRDRTTGPALTIVRALVLGFLILVVAITALILFIIGTVRLVNAYLPGNVWSAYLLLGTLFTLAGLYLWSKRAP